MIVFRLTKSKYKIDLSGKGAELFGGRWNPVGISALYTSETRALCVLELLAHTPNNLIPPRFELLSIEIPDKLFTRFERLADLPSEWNSLETNELTQQIGKLKFLRKDCLGFVVPSAIIKQEYNIILNPLCNQYNKVKIVESEAVNIDERLI